MYDCSLFHLCSALSAAKKAACSHPEASGEKREGEEGEKKDGVNGEVEEESNGKVKEGEAVPCGSKLRACRRGGAGEASGPGTELEVFHQFCLYSFMLK